MSLFRSIADVSKVYNNNRTLTIESHFISYPSLARFNSRLTAFSKVLGQDYEDSYWSVFLRTLKRYRFDICAAPWASESLKNHTREIYSIANQQIRDCHLIYPALLEPAQSLVSSLEVLYDEGQDPILESLKKIAKTSQSRKSQIEEVAILIKESRLVPVARSAISMTPGSENWSISVPHNLRDLKTYQQLIVIGHPAWFPAYVFTAPRASVINLLCYDWMNVNWNPKPALIAPTRGSFRAQRIRIDHKSSDLHTTAEDILPPEIDIKRVIDKAYRESSGEDETNTAQLLILESEKGVFIQAEGEASVLVIDLDQDSNQRVRRVPHYHLEPNMYILLRTSGGGDYLIPMADRLLGPRAEILREMQHTWKARLRLAAKQDGIITIIDKLKILGSRIANYQNIRNWMSDRTIVTEEFSEFLAIMKLVGLQKESQRYWEAMRDLRRAHTWAGQQIRRRLLEQVNKSDLGELERVGFMDFTLDEQDAGSLTAYRIRSIVPQTVEVLSNRIDHPFPLEDVKWR